MSLNVGKINNHNNIFTSSPQLNQTDMDTSVYHKRTLRDCRYRRETAITSKDKARALSGAIIGTALPLIFFAKKQKTNVLKMNYGFKEIASLALGANIGSVALSSIGKNKHEKKEKVNEGIFQIINSIIPMVLVDNSLKL